MAYQLDSKRSALAKTQSWPMGFLGIAQAATPFGGDSALQQWATNLATVWARRITTKPDEQQREIAKKVDWLAKDYENTLAEAQKREGVRKYGSQAIIRGWQISREQHMDFATLDRSVSKRFAPPAGAIELVSTKLVENSNKAPVAPLIVAFIQKLLQLYPQVRASNYRGHGGGAFRGRGFSLDLWLDKSPIDARGFYQPNDAVALLRAVHQAARAVGAEWRVLYNDYSVARVINQETGARRVAFVGGAFPGGGLNWHGPRPLILHFHLDLGTMRGVSIATASSTSSQPGSDKASAAPPSMFEVVFRILAGNKDINSLTNSIFYARHPERQGKPLQRGEPQFEKLRQEWLSIRDSVARVLPARS